jgi:hypothetical protein
VAVVVDADMEVAAVAMAAAVEAMVADGATVVSVGAINIFEKPFLTAGAFFAPFCR